MNVDKLSTIELLLFRSWLGDIMEKEPRHLEKASLHFAMIFIKKVDRELMKRLEECDEKDVVEFEDGDFQKTLENFKQKKMDV